MNNDQNNPTGQTPYKGNPNPQNPTGQPGQPLQQGQPRSLPQPQPPSLSLIYLCTLMPIVGWCIGFSKKGENKPSAGSVCLKLATVGFLLGMAGVILIPGIGFFGTIIVLGGALSYAQSKHKKILSGEIMWEG